MDGLGYSCSGTNVINTVPLVPIRELAATSYSTAKRVSSHSQGYLSLPPQFNAGLILEAKRMSLSVCTVFFDLIMMLVSIKLLQANWLRSRGWQKGI